MGTVAMRVLGTFEIVRDGAPVTLKSKKQRMLLLDLVIAGGQVVSRDRIIDDLWGDSAPASVDTTLNSYVSTLRSALEPDRERGSHGTMLLTRDPGYQLALDTVALDARDFERLVGEAARATDPAEAATLLDEALALVRGEPLCDVQYEDFAAAEAHRLSELILGAREQRIQIALDAGEHASWIGEIESLVRAHPMREGLRGELMLALYRSGRQADALRVFSEGRDLLVEELGIDPGPGLVELESRILAQDPTLLEVGAPAAAAPEAAPAKPAPARAAPAEPLVGRTEELGRIRRLLSELEAGRSAVLLIAGEAGMGKSRLVREIVRLAPEYGATDSVGAVLPAGAPLSPWMRAFNNYVDRHGFKILSLIPDHILRDFDRLYPPAATGRGLPAPELLTDEHGALAMVENLAEACVITSKHIPAVNAIEDLHWADRGTLQLFCRMAERLDDAPFLLVGTYRDDALHLTPALRDALARLAGKTRVETIRLAGIDVDAGHDLLEHTLGHDLERADVQAVVDRSLGNPLFMIELARAGVGQGTAFDPSVPVGREVADAIRSRIDLLPDDVVEMLEVGSFAAGTMAAGVDATVLDTGEDDIERRYDVAIEAGILEDDPAIPGNLRFSHALVREALYEAVPPRRRARIHARLGAAVEEHAGEQAITIAGHIARHYALGATAGTADAGIRWSIIAAEQAVAQFSHEEAVDHWQRALDLLGRSPGASAVDRSTILLGLGISARFNREPDRARDALLEAFSSGRDSGDHVLMGRVALELAEGAGTTDARVWWNPGQVALDAIDEVLELLDAAAEPALVSALLARRAADGVDLSPEERRVLITRAFEVAGPLAQAELATLLHAAAITAQWDVASVDELLALADDGCDLAIEQGDSVAELQMRRWGVAYSLMLGETRDAEDRADEAHRRADLLGPEAGGIALTTLQPMIDVIQGRYDQAEQGHRHYFENPPPSPFLSETHLIAFANLEWQRGNIGAWVDMILDRVKSSHRPSIAGVLALIHVWEDDHRAAREVLRRFRPAELEKFGGAVYGGLLPWSLAQVGAALDDRPLTEQMYERLGWIEHKLVLPGPGMIPMGVVDQALARAALYLGDLDAAQRHLDAVYPLLERLQAVPWKLQTDLVAADLLRARGDDDAARDLLEAVEREALETGSKLAGTLAERALQQ